MGESEGAAARRAIDERRETWIAAINAGDAERFVSILREDAVWLPWSQAALMGRARIRDWLSDPFAKYEYDYSVTDVRVRIAGDWAVERARFRTRAIQRGVGEAPVHEGAYTILWRRTASEGWLIDRYIDHTGNQPPWT